MKTRRLLTCAVALVVLGGIARAEEEDPPKDNTRPDVGARYSAIWRNLGDPSGSRRQVLADLKALAHGHPRSEYAHRARQDVAILAKMVREDEERRRRPVKYQRLAKQEQIADCIFRLRDIDHQMIPVVELLGFSYDAVPALIASLRDERFTRHIEGSSPTRVGAWALFVLEWIANKQFRESKDEYDIDRSEAARKKVEAWWKEAQTKGEKRMWVEGTERGDNRSFWDAGRLIKRYPEVALNSIAKGIGRSKDVEVRRALLYAADDIKDARVIDLFRQELNGPHWKSRLQAANLFHLRGRPEGVEAMIREWRALGKEASGEQASTLVQFFVDSGNPKAIEALGPDLRRRPVTLRLRTVDVVERALRVPALSGEVRTVINQILVACLDDGATYAEEHRGKENEVCVNPRICDRAAKALAEAWAPAVSFREWNSVTERDRQIIGIKNYWRLKQNMKPLPVPAP